MNTLSVGLPSTLGSYLELCDLCFGKDSKPSEYFRKQIAESPNGAAEEVLAAESQMMYLIGSLLQGEHIE
jgi:hypothetical protein